NAVHSFAARTGRSSPAMIAPLGGSPHPASAPQLSSDNCDVLPDNRSPKPVAAATPALSDSTNLRRNGIYPIAIVPLSEECHCVFPGGGKFRRKRSRSASDHAKLCHIRLHERCSRDQEDS